MTRISGLFSRRGFNIESLTVGHTETPGKSRFTIVVKGDDQVLEQVRKQLQKLIHVIRAWDIKQENCVEREHALIKIKVEDKKRAEILQVITAVQARIIDSTESIWTLEVTGDSSTVESAFNLFKNYPVLESIRTGKLAMERGAGKFIPH
jgi:acetolactate synthase-1/3 small subunit